MGCLIADSSLSIIDLLPLDASEVYDFGRQHSAHAEANPLCSKLFQTSETHTENACERPLARVSDGPDAVIVCLCMALGCRT